MKLAFEKWEGLGNDFVLLDAAPCDAELARRLCDRRLGVGGDGVLVLEGALAGALRMTVWNADGSRPEMCGNGLRCAAAYVARARGLVEATLAFATDAGERACFVSQRDVDVDMGVARPGAELTLHVDGEDLQFATVDVGNPHAVTFASFDAAAIDRVGPRVSASPPAGFNVEFCRVSKGRIDVVVWERGVGRTLACGTGACAVALVACETGRADFGAPLVVGLPGGDLEVRVDEASRRVRLRGPARRVFSGEVELP